MLSAFSSQYSSYSLFCGLIIGFQGSSDYTFCSEFVTQTLQVGGVEFTMKTNAGRSTSSSLLHFMNCRAHWFMTLHLHGWGPVHSLHALQTNVRVGYRNLVYSCV